ncbi:MAG: RHS repeat-associated core domain-containing protein [Bacteroidetes bacterium]|nr:RHS repeat-associated core domain-containing protein [Bacteroidota bacterium]
MIIFPGQYYDSETGLHYNWHRFYDPETGRYISADPIGLAGGDVNLYSYVWQDPINWQDFTGLFGDGRRKWRKKKGPRGHSDFYGGNKFDFTREDYGNTSPYRDPQRHFLSQNDPMSLPAVFTAIENCDQEAFERAMHRYQDSFSHYNKGYRWDPGNENLPCYGWGHVCDGTKPDNDADAWKKANDTTRSLVKEYNQKCGCPAELVPTYEPLGPGDWE